MSKPNLSNLTSLVSEMFASISGDGNNTITIGDVTLSQSTVLVDNVSLDMLPVEFRKQFFFSESSVVQPKSSYQASSVVISVLPMRLNSDGCVVPCGLSLWGAIRQSDKEKHPLGESNSVPRLKADIYLEAGFYSFGELSLAVPTVVRKPYIKGVNENLAAFNIALSDRATDEEQVEVEYNSVRDEFQDKLATLAKEAGIAANQQFAVCVVGFPTYTKGFKGKDESMPAWYSATLPEGGYLLGVTKLGSVGKRELPEDLAGYAVNRANLMVGGRSFDDLLLEQIKGIKSDSSKSVAPKAPQTEKVRPNNQTNNTVTQQAATDDIPDAWKKCDVLKRALILCALKPGKEAQQMVLAVDAEKPAQLFSKYYNMVGLDGPSLLALLKANKERVANYAVRLDVNKQLNKIKEANAPVTTVTPVVSVEPVVAVEPTVPVATTEPKVAIAPQTPASKTTAKTSISDLLSALDEDEEEEVLPVKAKSFSVTKKAATTPEPVSTSSDVEPSVETESTDEAEVKQVKAKSINILSKLANRAK